jgi:hypothetical protein
VGEIAGGVARERDRLDLRAMPIEELLGNIRNVPGHSGKVLQRLEADAAGYFCRTVAHREIDGAPYSISEASRLEECHAIGLCSEGRFIQ